MKGTLLPRPGKEGEPARPQLWAQEAREVCLRRLALSEVHEKKRRGPGPTGFAPLGFFHDLALSRQLHKRLAWSGPPNPTGLPQRQPTVTLLCALPVEVPTGEA